MFYYVLIEYKYKYSFSSQVYTNCIIYEFCDVKYNIVSLSLSCLRSQGKEGKYVKRSGGGKNRESIDESPSRQIVAGIRNSSFEESNMK